MNNQNDKYPVTSNLNKLKETSEKVSVADDYTVKKRKEIKKSGIKSELKGNGKCVFKVRGTPKNVLVIRRFTMTISATQE